MSPEKRPTQPTHRRLDPLAQEADRSIEEIIARDRLGLAMAQSEGRRTLPTANRTGRRVNVNL